MSPTHLDDVPPVPPVSLLDALDERRSVPARQLGTPAPDEATLLRMLASACRVPDHGKRVPWRFVSVQGDARLALGERLATLTASRDPEAAPAAIEKDRERFSHAPLVVTVIARLGEDAQIPGQERLLTAGCVCFALLQAAQGLGFGASWLTGWPAYDRTVHGWLGLSDDEAIAGFIHIGTPRLEAPERERPDPATLLTDWRP
ncbi:nitroreductase [Lysobacter sp. SG-8]|uniref:Putative NAD(P)H nitroreductase n=1 Tax=Marilutibacter penaei TaxID=2759900 RepID=A0A7W3U3U8_9GAMM|nr:nitroreductase [Lysobacter penaei]MBB1088446.1 nitroreductase [Lysobacter penaei]